MKTAGLALSVSGVHDDRVVPVQTWTRRAYRRADQAPRHRLSKVQRALMALLRRLPSNQPFDIWCSDDSLAWFRTLGFLSDPDFIRAHQEIPEQIHHQARLWRTYTSGWAIRSAIRLGGHVVDLGCYDGVHTEILSRYVGAIAETVDWDLYDTFVNPPSGILKRGHGETLYADVCRRFAAHPNVHVRAGILPASLVVPEKISVILVDLNDGATEVACLEQLWDALLPGGLIVLDDYGDSQFPKTFAAHQAFFAERGHDVYESQTGQGLVLKR